MAAVPPVGSTTQPAPADTHQHLYLDFGRNAERLTEVLHSLWRAHAGKFLPNAGAEILRSFVDTVFPEAMSQAYCFCNTSLKPGYFYLTIRPSEMGPRLEAAFPRGLVPCIHGNPHPNLGLSPVVTVNGIALVAAGPPRPFEQERTVLPFSQQENVYPFSRRRNDLLVPSFLTALPPISQTTQARLRDWRGCIGWKEQVVRTGLVGIRYLAIDLAPEGLLQFLVVAESEDAFGQFQRFLRRQELMVFPLAYSQNPWTFQCNASYQGSFVDLGDFRHHERLDGVPYESRDGMPWPNPFAARLFFEMPENLQGEADGLMADDHGALEELVRNNFPAQGFLALSAAGDLALLRRHAKSLDTLEQQCGCTPYLSSYLFDITKANPPERLEEVAEWLFSDLNEDQKLAVRKMLSAPDICLLQGPPGTGKTIVIGEGSHQNVLRGKKVLIASQSHQAVDNALERLADSPAVRAVRLGAKDKSNGRSQFTTENVLGQYYRTVARLCRKRTLDLWAATEKRVAERERTLEQMDLMSADATRCEATLRDISERRAALDRERAAEVARLEAARERGQQREHLERFHCFLSGSSEDSFLLPEALLDAFYQNVVLPLDSLSQTSTAINPYWRERRGDSPGMRSRFAWNIIQRWREIQADTPTLRADLARLREMQGDRILAPQAAIELDGLDREIARLQEDLVHDGSLLGRYQEFKRRQSELRGRGAGLDRTIYERVFPEERHGQPAHLLLTSGRGSRKEAVSFLDAAVERVDKAAARVEQGLDAVRARTREAIAALGDATPDETTLRRLDGEIRFLSARTDEAREQREERQRLLRDEMRRAITTTDAGRDQPLPEYPEFRSRMVAEIEKDRAHLAQQAEFRSVWEPLLRDWVKDLEAPENAQHDRHWVLDDYITSCNVVGVTCNEKRFTLEAAGHSHFDVVIVDEVSKATPVELLMVMMMARTAILVGDHRQLPPTFREREGCWEEAVNDREEQGDTATELTRQNFEKHRKMVTASLFKELFEQAPDSLKAFLFTQYRMHPDIMMAVVDHFYEHKLRCGLQDPDGTVPGSDPRHHRRHGLTLRGHGGRPYVTPDQHAVWIDSSFDPSGKEHFEQQAGTSKVNDLEAVLIAIALADIDAECFRQVYTEEKPKEVAVISFYGRQVRHIREAIQRLQAQRGKPFGAIHYDVNTVDRFQGREAPIVLVSLTRNKRQSGRSSRAFVAQFERINVAFSRARELLIVFGSKRMFHSYQVTIPNLDRPGSMRRRVYQAILDDLLRRGCLWDASRVLSPEAYRKLLPQPAQASERI